tara:strand:+ start:12689 stop:12853 length:165 start_codon:yes stop_codon:yes gene_type:complete
MNPENLRELGKLSIAAILAIGLLFLFNKMLDQLHPILLRQTEALESIERVYTGK